MSGRLSQEKSLLEEISEEEYLMIAWKELRKSNLDSYGLSGVTIEDYKKKLDENIPSLSVRLKTEGFKFSPTRAAVMPKDRNVKNEKFRPLQIPEVEDRIVMKAIALKIEQELQSVLNQSKGMSFAYKKGLGVKDAVLKMKSVYEKGKTFILKADIINFFGEINKDELLEKVFLELRDTSINVLLKEALGQEVKGLEKLKKKKHKDLFNDLSAGIPQGNPISPILSNIYLASFDAYMKSIGCNLVRYADDFVVLCESRVEAKNLYKSVELFLKEKLRLRIHPISSRDFKKKTSIINPTKEEFIFLSIHFDGINLMPSRKKIVMLKKKIRSIIFNNNKEKNVCEKVVKVVSYWVSKYTYTNIDIFYNELDSFLGRHLMKVLVKQGVLKYNESTLWLNDKERKEFKIPYLKDIVQSRKEKQEKKKKRNKNN